MQTDEEGAANEVSDGQQTRMVDGELHWWMVKLLLHVLHELRAHPGTLKSGHGAIKKHLNLFVFL